MPSSDLPRLNRILVVRLDNVGDAVLLSPALRALRGEYPEAEIVALLSPAAATAAPMLPWIDEVSVLRAPWQDASGTMPLDPEGLLEVSRDLAGRRFDVALIFTSFSQSPWPPGYACYLAGIPVRVGESKEFGGSILSHAAPTLPDAAHQADRNLHLLRSVGIAAEDGRLELHIPGEAAERAEALRRETGVEGPYFLVAPGASCPARRYDPRRFAEAARLVAERTGVRAIIAGSERERRLCEALSREVGGAVTLGGRTSIPELAALIEGAELLIANDSGPMHIADAVGCPMAIAFSGTELESQWEPRSAPAVLLRRPTDCAPCYRFECAYSMECVDIAPSEVAEAAFAVLAMKASREVSV